MLRVKTVFFALCILFPVIATHSVQAQNDPKYNLFLKRGTMLPKENLSDHVNLRIAGNDDLSLVIIQFEALLSEEEKAELKRQGIVLLDYIPNNAYVATVRGNSNGETLKRFKARSIITLNAEDKMDAALASGIIPVHAEKVAGMADVWINFPKSFSFEEVINELSKLNIEVISSSLQIYQVIALRVAKSRLKELAELPCVQYVQVIPVESTPLIDKSVVNSRANVLGSNTLAGFNLEGSGVVIGVGDNSSPLSHVDVNNRIINYSSGLGGYHGMGVIGIAAGAGIANEKYKGYAPKSQVLARFNEGIWRSAAAYARNHNMVITNNSYAGTAGLSCPDFGEYTVESYILDQQAFDLPYLQHVFAAGNSGQTNLCSTYPLGFGTVLSSYQAAKNVLSVGNNMVTGIVGASSSKGPVKDGRTKPDLTAQGTNITFTYPGDLYKSASGTSFAAPAVSGGLALLYERYRQLHKNANPKNALMKALVCNGADDKGLAGPDYSYGYGTLNLLRSLQMLNQDNYFEDSLRNQEDRLHSVTVPDRTSQLKVMLYWNDPAGSFYSGKTLVHNLDLSLTDPNGSVVLPKILNPASVLTSATTGVDDVNNMEQIVIDNPVPGNYSVRVNGKSVPQGIQNYFVVYDTIRIATKLTYPIGKEHLSGGDQIYISWDSYGNAESSFKVQYSVDNGASWNTINAEVAANLRQLVWPVPDKATTLAKVRIVQNATGVTCESESFVILGAPVLALSPVQCEGFIAIQWPAIAGATDYEVMMLKGTEMNPVAATSALNYTFDNLSGDSAYYVSVRARINGVPGRRGVALSRTPNNGSCQGSISDNDLKVESIISPAGSGRLHTSTELSASEPVKVRIKNLDDIASEQPIQIGYSIGDEGSAVYWETVSPTILPGGFYEHTFSKKADLHQSGNYRFNVYVKKANDLILTNNSLVRTFKQLENTPVSLPFRDDFENLEKKEIILSTIGLPGGERYDFKNSGTFGRLRTFDNSGAIPPGAKSILLDASRGIESPNTNFLDATFNLAKYHVAKDEIKLSFTYFGFGKVYVRGNDKSPWIAATKPGYSDQLPVNISSIFLENGMEFSENVQVRWEQTGTGQITPDSDNYDSFSSYGGYGIDDIFLFRETNDIELVNITKTELFCEYGELQGINVVVRNNSPTSMSQVQLKMQIDENAVKAIRISMNGGQTQTFNLARDVDISLPGAHKIKVWVENSGDLFPENNAAEIGFDNPVISAFPYLENFERGEGGWHLGNCMSSYYSQSWEFGTPAAAKINRAASGTKAWKTNLTGNYNNGVTSYLYSPWFETGAMENPTLSFSLALDVQSCANQECDIAYVEYFSNGLWKKLGNNETGTNWYNLNGGWSIENFTRWHVSTMSLPKGIGSFRLRFVIMANWDTNREGVAIDDIHIYDLKHKIYGTGPVSSPITMNNVSGKEWVNFTENDKIVASILTNNLNLGNTTVQTYLNQQAVRNASGQYYFDRNYTIKPVNRVQSERVSVRLFFSDSEIEKLVNASGCSNCESVKSAYDLSISKFQSADQSLEDGSLKNNSSGSLSFLSSDKVVKVPYDVGYYAEFETSSFSEFWLAKREMRTDAPLPVELISFEAKKRSAAENERLVALKWVTSSEKNFSRFEVELAIGSDDLRKNAFSKIGEVRGQGNDAATVQYEYTDRQRNQLEVLYYRLKMVDTDNSFTYSAIRSVVSDEISAPRLYPNPSNGLYNLEFQSEQNSPATVKIYETSGRLVQSIKMEPATAIRKQKIDLSSFHYQTGLYIIELTNGKQKKTFKVIKQDTN